MDTTTQPSHDACAVCLGELDPTDTTTNPVIRFPHGHTLHLECYRQLRANGIHTCPLCRRPFGRKGGRKGR
ncbi:hypothetical protein HK097_004169, partial [Rhizophlyctis rosea]